MTLRGQVHRHTAFALIAFLCACGSAESGGNARIAIVYDSVVVFDTIQDLYAIRDMLLARCQYYSETVDTLSNPVGGSRFLSAPYSARPGRKPILPQRTPCKSAVGLQQDALCENSTQSNRPRMLSCEIKPNSRESML